ncbi:ATP-binding cassette domain-containing protein [Neolewinella persica]|uniref:ATP-binding cassette domain-containing protein n=1 Tax=Neolewinella persica TaxID=70998 RepID=UPI0003676DB6|nr:ABC transporter ATP-binding protein [Neolewinella persica]
MLKVTNLTISFPGAEAPAVDRLSFELAAGGRLGLLGLSGSGKSLTALALVGLLPDSARLESGEAWYQPADGPAVDLLQLTEKQWRTYRSKHLSLIFQEPLTALNPVHTIGAQLMEAVIRFRPDLTTRTDRKTCLLNWLTRVELSNDQARMLRAYPHQLSGGQRQRLLIALALLGRPQLLIADEPTTALDTITEAGILDLLARLRAELGMATLFITHDLGVMRRSAEEVMVMAAGKVVRRGDTQTVLEAGARLFQSDETEVIDKQGANHQTETPGHQTIDGPQNELCLTVDGLSLSYPTPKAWPWSKTSPVTAVKAVSFTLGAGEWLAIVGPSGCGKSSLARCLAGLLPPTKGQFHYPANGRVQLVFQDPFSSLNPAHTILRSIIEVLRVAMPGRKRATYQDEAGRLLQEVGLSPAIYANRSPNALSGGQRQRVAIARALAGRPTILIADEAVSALDAPLRRDVLDLLQNICREQQIGLLFISHDLGLVAERADRVIIMDQGQIVETGPAATVFRQPASEMGKRLLAAAALPDH